MLKLQSEMDISSIYSKLCLTLTLQKKNNVNPLTPVLAVTSLGLSSTFDVTAFDQDLHHLCSTSAGGKDLSDDTQIRVICPMEP